MKLRLPRLQPRTLDVLIGVSLAFWWLLLALTSILVCGFRLGDSGVAEAFMFALLGWGFLVIYFVKASGLLGEDGRGDSA